MEEVRAGSKATVLTSAGTTQLKTTAGTLGAIFIAEVGTTMTVNVFDDANSDDATKQVLTYLTADGKQNYQLGIPMSEGIRITIGGTPGRVVVVWS